MILASPALGPFLFRSESFKLILPLIFPSSSLAARGVASIVLLVCSNLIYTNVDQGTKSGLIFQLVASFLKGARTQSDANNFSLVK